MTRKLLVTSGLALVAVAGVAGYSSALSQDRWTDATPYGVFFNDYDPNFHASFVPRVQERERIKIHLARGNQLRVRMVLSDATLDNYLLDQVAKHDLYQELIEKQIITLTSNTVWEDYHQRFEAEGLRELAARKGGLSPKGGQDLAQPQPLRGPLPAGDAPVLQDQGSRPPLAPGHGVQPRAAKGGLRLPDRPQEAPAGLTRRAAGARATRRAPLLRATRPSITLRRPPALSPPPAPAAAGARRGA